MCPVYRQLLGCAQQLYLYRVNPLGEDRIPGPPGIESGHNCLDTGSIQAVGQVQHDTELRPRTAAGDNGTAGC